MPGKPGVEYTLSGDSAEVVNALKKIADQVDRTEKKMEAMSRKGAAGSQQAATGFEKAAQGAGRMAGAIASAVGIGGVFATAIATIRAEFQKTIEIAENARKAQVGFAGSTRNLLVNFSADRTLDAAGLRNRIDKIAETGTGRNEIAAALSTAFSAKGNLSNEVAASAVEEAFRLLPGDVQSAQQLSGRALDIAKATGETDVKGILGQLVQAQGAARVTNIGQLGSSAIPAALSVIGAGGTSEQGLELFSALSNIAGDERGDQTSTAVIALVEQLKNFTPEARGKDAKGQRFAIPQAQRDAFAAATNTDERIAVLQESEELRRAFLGQASFEKKLQTPIERVLSGDADAALAAARGAITGVGGGIAARAFDDKVADLNAGPFQDLGRAQRDLDVAVEEFELGGNGGRALVRETLLKGLKASSVTGAELGGRLRFDAKVGLGADPAAEATSILESNLANTRRDGGADNQIQLLETAIALIKKIEADKDKPQRVEVVNQNKPEDRPANQVRRLPGADLGN